jgi:hypothetical protein
MSKRYTKTHFTDLIRRGRASSDQPFGKDAAEGIEWLMQAWAQFGDGEGHSAYAREGHADTASSSPSEREGAGQSAPADNVGQRACAPPSRPHEGDAGHHRRASNGQGQAAPSPSPHREPSPAQIEAAGAVKLHLVENVKKSIWDKLEFRFKLDLRRTRLSELFSIRDLGWLAEMIVADYPSANMHAFLGTEDRRRGIPRLLTDGQMARYAKKVEGRVNACKSAA